jgi:hypothetical protein
MGILPRCGTPHALAPAAMASSWRFRHGSYIPRQASVVVPPCPLKMSFAIAGLPHTGFFLRHSRFPHSLSAPQRSPVFLAHFSRIRAVAVPRNVVKPSNRVHRLAPDVFDARARILPGREIDCALEQKGSQ